MMINETIICLIPADPSYIFTPSYKNFYEPLKQIFSKAIHYDFLKRYYEAGVIAVNREIIDIVKAEHPKYVFWAASSYQIQESTLNYIREQGAITIGWFGDDEFRFDDYSKWWIPYLDYILTADRMSVKKYEELGGRAFCFAMYPNPDFYKRLSPPPKYDVSFVGSKHAVRTPILEEFKRRGMTIHTFGRGWESGYVTFEEMVNIFNASKINLNFAGTESGCRQQMNYRPQIKARIFEICMCGGFLLTEYVQGIEEYFEVDKEIVCFRDIEEAIANIKYYLSHETERKAIAEAGWERSRRDYTMVPALSKIFREIQMDVKSGNLQNELESGILKMPLRIRKIHSIEYCAVGKILFGKNYEGRWKDEFALALSYYPFNIEAWVYYIIGSVPSFMRPALIRILKRLNSAKNKFCESLLSWLPSIPYLRKIKQSFAKWLLHKRIQ